MPKLFLLFSHNLSSEQVSQAKSDLGITELISLPANLQRLWSNVPPELVSLKDYLKPFNKFLKQEAKVGDYCLIQGDMGAVYSMVNIVRQLNLRPIYATTKRIVKEQSIDGKTIKTSEFKHILFRGYE